MNSIANSTVRDFFGSLRVRSKDIGFSRVGEKIKSAKVVRLLSAAICKCFTVVAITFKFALKFISWITAYTFRHPFQMAVNVILTASLVIMAITGSEINEKVILSQISEDTVLQMIEASKYNRGFNNEELKRDGARELTAVGAPAWVQREGIRAILYHARKASLPIEDQAVLLAIANIESGFNPLAQANITTACGLFQFVQATGEMVSLKTAECMDPWKNAAAGVNHFIANYNQRVRPYVENLTGPERAFRTFELSYYLHHDGPASSNPSNEVKAIVLDGTQFLFVAYHTLLKEQESEKSAPTFSGLFTARMWSLIVGLKERFSPTSVPLIAWITDSGEKKEA